MGSRVAPRPAVGGCARFGRVAAEVDDLATAPLDEGRVVGAASVPLRSERHWPDVSLGGLTLGIDELRDRLLHARPGERGGLLHDLDPGLLQLLAVLGASPFGLTASALTLNRVVEHRPPGFADQP